MLKLESHGIDRKREFSGEENCRLAIAWLNEGVEDPGRMRVRQLLRDVQVLASNWVTVIDEDDGEPALTYKGSIKAFTKAHANALRLLKRYKFSPIFLPFGG